MADIYLYESNATDLEGMGLVGALTPTECLFSEEANGLSEIHLTHPLDEWARYTQLAVGRILKAPVPVRSLPEIENGEIVSSVEYWQVKEGAAKDLRWAWSKESGGCRTGLPKPLQRVTVVKKGNSRYKIKYTKTDSKGKKSSASGWINKNALEYISEQDIGDDPNAIEEVAPAWSVREQYFRIYEVRSSDMNGEGRGVTVSARHIFYDLMGNLTIYKPEGAVGCQAALDGILSGCVSGHDFEAATNIGASREAQWVRVNPVSAILDPDDGLCAKFGGDLVRDNWDITLLDSAGMNRGVRIEYRKNMLGVECQVNTDSVVTRVYPMGQTAKGKPLGMGGDAPWVDSPKIGDYPTPHIYVLDKGSEIKAKSTSGADVNSARSQLQQAAQAYFSDNPGIDEPEISLSVDFVSLGDTAEYAQYRNLESVHLYDTVRIRHAPLNIDVLAQVNKIEFDCLTGRMKGIELGSKLINLAREKVPAWQLPGNINGAKLINGTVEAGQLAGGAVNDENMADGAVNAGKLQDGAVVFGKIAADAIDADNIRAGAVTAGKIAAGAVAADNIEAGAITAGKIAAGSITADQLQAGLITADSGLIDTGAIGTAQIADGSITDAKIVGLTANKITAGTIDASQVYINNIVADNITTGTLNGKVIPQLGTDKLQDGAVTGDKVAQNAITADKVVAGAITTDKLAAASITANKIAANAIQAGHIQAGAVTTGALAAGAVTADKLAANSITADKLAVGNFSNLAKDPSFEQYSVAGSYWGISGDVARSGAKSLKLRGGAPGWQSVKLSDGYFPVAAGDQFYVEWWAYRADANQPVGLNIAVNNYDGTISYDIPGSITSKADQANRTWIKKSYIGTVSKSGMGYINAKSKGADVLAGDWYIDDIVVRRISDHVNANAVEISPENGIVVTQSSLNTRFQADASRFGIYDGSGVMLAGAGYDAGTGKGYFATRQIRNTSKNSGFRIEMTDEDLSGADTGGEGLSCYKGTVLLGGMYAGQAIYGGGSGGGTVNYLRIWGSQNVEVTSEGPLNFNASGAANYYSPENHYFTGGSILTERNIRPMANGAANCGLPDYRWRYIYTQNQVNVSSDARKKRDIAPIEDARALVMGLRPRQYRLRSEGKDGKRHTGFIAQHVLKSAPDWAAADGSDPYNLGLMYGEILAPLVQVVQDQQREIEKLKARLSEMEASACGKSE